MNFRLLVRVTAPAVAVGLLLLAACLASIRYISRLQSNLARVLADNVTSLQAAQELEIRVRQLRFHTMIYLMDPEPARLGPVERDQVRFEEALDVARRACTTPDEFDCVRKIEAAYHAYQAEQAELRTAAGREAAALALAAGGLAAQARFLAAGRGGPPFDFPLLADTHPVRRVVDPCKDLLHINKEKMEQTAAECRRVSDEGNVAMLVLGMAGPFGGLVLGYGVARALRRSIYRLSVRVQDMAQALDEKVASVSVAADGDIGTLDRQMGHIIGKIEEVADRLRRQQRELLRAEQLSAMGQLAAGVAHEVRNPLTAIKMLVEAALRTHRPRPLGAEDARIIHREVARLERTVQGFLDFARLPAAERAECDLRGVVEQARDLVRVRARQQGVELAVSTPDEPVPASVDRGQLGTVLVNLFLNALDAMPSGGRLEVTLEPPAAGGIRLTVCDTGSGIPPEILPRLFSPFATTKPTGTGLGLSISGRILEEHGGAITAQNRPAGGACFVVTLPDQRSEERRQEPADF